MTGWLLSTKSCVVTPGVRFAPATSASEIAMPRTSFSWSDEDEALANLMNAE